MNLNQQLEDKKKELESLEHPDCMGNWEENQGEKHKICQAEISILEQAITEMQKQRQEDFKKLVLKLKSCDEFFNVRGYENTIRTDKFMGIVHLFIHQIEQEQLNQPKTEKKNSKLNRRRINHEI